MLGPFNLNEKKKPANTTYKQYSYIFHGRKLVVQGYERQALEYLVSIGHKPEDLRSECEFGDGLRIRYKYRGEVRKYLPDIYHLPSRTVYEVKSMETMGLNNEKRRGWSMNRAKAKACLAKGFKFDVLLMTRNGKRIPLPDKWYNMTKQECLDKMNLEESGLNLI